MNFPTTKNTLQNRTFAAHSNAIQSTKMPKKIPSQSIPNLHTEIRGNLLLVRLSRPEKRNALNNALILGLETVFTTLPEGIACAIIYGEGDHFSAGLDLSDITEQTVMEGVLHSRMWHKALHAIQFGKVPVVVALHGAVVGGGLELACAAHIRVADESTFYALPEGQRGIFVGGGASARLPKLIGVARMMDMMLTGRVVKAEEGMNIGISQYVVPTGGALEKALALAAKIAQNAPATNFALTHVLPRIAELGQDQGLMMESLMAAIAQSTPEAKDRLHQFLNKKAKKVGEA
jgi:(methylthio)acryloyl-CoA hydratase